jgi:hypothetical protein
MIPWLAARSSPNILTASEVFACLGKVIFLIIPPAARDERSTYCDDLVMCILFVFLRFCIFACLCLFACLFAVACLCSLCSL